MAHDVHELEHKLTALGESTAKLAAAKHADALLSIIRRPGYTSKIEDAFVHAMVDALQHQVIGLHQAFDALHSVADMIGKK